MTQEKAKIRNIAITAHIDHGKTTLLDALLKQAHIFREGAQLQTCMMDSHDQERERGITIYAKHTSIMYGDNKINIIDTPGHADFSGEVERILGMVNCVLLLVDAQEGPMPQTRFVLSKALKKGLHPIVVINKIDKPNANPDYVLSKTFDLFIELGATDSQLDFQYCYASGVNGFAMAGLNDERKDMQPLLDLIMRAAPAPEGDRDAPFEMQTATISYNDYLGRQATGRILNGTVKRNMPITSVTPEGKTTNARVTRIQGYLGMGTVDLDEAYAGDIVSIAGVEEVNIGDALCDPATAHALPAILIDEPTVSITMRVNNSPFAGQDGKHVTINKIRERLEKEQRSNVSMRFEDVGADAIKISGRGELHLAVLIESMRREGFEMTISKPQVIIKQIDGEKCEPIELAALEVPEAYSGGVIEELNRRKGEMQNLHTNEHGICSMEFLIPTRGLMGYRNAFLTNTRGLGILTSIFDSYKPFKGELPGRKQGVMVAVTPGRCNSYAIFHLQPRGFLNVVPGDECYKGMIVGEHNRDNDLGVNITKEKKLTNVRASGTDEALTLTPARKFTLEQAIDFIENDECLEVTPNFIRMRKVDLDKIKL